MRRQKPEHAGHGGRSRQRAERSPDYEMSESIVQKYKSRHSDDDRSAADRQSRDQRRTRKRGKRPPGIRLKPLDRLDEELENESLASSPGREYSVRKRNLRNESRVLSESAAEAVSESRQTTRLQSNRTSIMTPDQSDVHPAISKFKLLADKFKRDDKQGELRRRKPTNPDDADFLSDLEEHELLSDLALGSMTDEETEQFRMSVWVYYVSNVLFPAAVLISLFIGLFFKEPMLRPLFYNVVAAAITILVSVAMIVILFINRHNKSKGIVLLIWLTTIITSLLWVGGLSLGVVLTRKAYEGPEQTVSKVITRRRRSLPEPRYDTTYCTSVADYDKWRAAFDNYQTVDIATLWKWLPSALYAEPKRVNGYRRWKNEDIKNNPRYGSIGFTLGLPWGYLVDHSSATSCGTYSLDGFIMRETELSNPNDPAMCKTIKRSYCRNVTPLIAWHKQRHDITCELMYSDRYIREFERRFNVTEDTHSGPQYKYNTRRPTWYSISHDGSTIEVRNRDKEIESCQNRMLWCLNLNDTEYLTEKFYKYHHKGYKDTVRWKKQHGPNFYGTDQIKVLVFESFQVFVSEFAAWKTLMNTHNLDPSDGITHRVDNVLRKYAPAYFRIFIYPWLVYRTKHVDYRYVSHASAQNWKDRVLEYVGSKTFRCSRYLHNEILPAGNSRNRMSAIPKYYHGGNRYHYEYILRLQNKDDSETSIEYQFEIWKENDRINRMVDGPYKTEQYKYQRPYYGFDNRDFSRLNLTGGHTEALNIRFKVNNCGHGEPCQVLSPKTFDGIRAHYPNETLPNIPRDCSREAKTDAEKHEKKTMCTFEQCQLRNKCDQQPFERRFLTQHTYDFISYVDCKVNMAKDGSNMKSAPIRQSCGQKAWPWKAGYKKTIEDLIKFCYIDPRHITDNPLYYGGKDATLGERIYDRRYRYYDSRTQRLYEELFQCERSRIRLSFVNQCVENCFNEQLSAYGSQRKPSVGHLGHRIGKPTSERHMYDPHAAIPYYQWHVSNLIMREPWFPVCVASNCATKSINFPTSFSFDNFAKREYFVTHQHITTSSMCGASAKREKKYADFKEECQMLRRICGRSEDECYLLYGPRPGDYNRVDLGQFKELIYGKKLEFLYSKTANNPEMKKPDNLRMDDQQDTSSRLSEGFGRKSHSSSKKNSSSEDLIDISSIGTLTTPGGADVIAVAVSTVFSGACLILSMTQIAIMLCNGVIEKV